MIRKVVSLSFLICAVLCQAEQAVWQLGKPDGSGKVFAYKHNNFWTPELLEGLTIHGLMPDTNVKVEKSPGKVVYTIKVPLRELYPLSEKTKEFGFSWLVNDNDGNGRKYIQWSSGIGPSKTPVLFGYISVRGE